jgi:hypothetical protein
MCKIFELMTCPVPVSYHEELWGLRIQALYLLNIEELSKVSVYVQMGGQTTTIFQSASKLAVVND